MNGKYDRSNVAQVSSAFLKLPRFFINKCPNINKDEVLNFK